jgi:hypothetical protein
MTNLPSEGGFSAGKINDLFIGADK